MHWGGLAHSPQPKRRRGDLRNLKIWLIMSVTQDLWTPHGIVDQPWWNSTDFHGAPLNSMDSHENPWTFTDLGWGKLVSMGAAIWSMSMGVHGCLWNSLPMGSFVSTNVHGCPWNSMPMGSFVSINVHGSPWKSIDAHGCSWKSIDAHRCPWMPISVHQYQVPFLKRPQEAPSFGWAPLPAPSLGCPSGSCMGYGPYYDEYTYVH